MTHDTRDNGPVTRDTADLGQGVEHGVLLVLLQRVAQAREYQHAHAATLTCEHMNSPSLVNTQVLHNRKIIYLLSICFNFTY